MKRKQTIKKNCINHFGIPICIIDFVSVYLDGILLF